VKSFAPIKLYFENTVNNFANVVHFILLKGSDFFLAITLSLRISTSFTVLPVFKVPLI